MSTSPLTEKHCAEDLPPSIGASVVVNGRYLPPPEDEDGKLWVRTSALVLKDAQTLYEMWRNVEAAPRWQEHIVNVVETGATTSRWSMKTSNEDDAKVISWESEVLADEPGVRIAWRSIGGESDNAGEVIFEEAPNGVGTVVTVLQEFRMGKLASTWETLVGRHPKQAVVENLRHFKALAETGEIPRTQLDPHGDRGVIGNFKRSSYGETVPTPTGGN
ncbi:putative membrane protein [Granulicella aggregans]|uniref:Putative membrane protein n=1 Tax=Granulicella aggregans TaxID=474949 RepID=A0A7W8E612_9BACT|nr:SRPBCC family protein [Granulicella aggregans]MBB5060197.1 putative membrane protein [Granulicella aggregans]